MVSLAQELIATSLIRPPTSNSSTNQSPLMVRLRKSLRPVNEPGSLRGTSSASADSSLQKKLSRLINFYG